MSINRIDDGMESLLTERMARIRRVERREGEAGGASREFQQLFEFARRDKDETEKNEAKKPEPVEAPPPLPKALTLEQIENSRKRNELAPGQLIDIKA
jgi:hypothetical protein